MSFYSSRVEDSILVVVKGKRHMEISFLWQQYLELLTKVNLQWSSEAFRRITGFEGNRSADNNMPFFTQIQETTLEFMQKTMSANLRNGHQNHFC